MSLDPIGLTVTDLEALKAFFSAALAPLDMHLLAEFPRVAGFGRAPKPEFWFAQSDEPRSGVHIAFAACARAEVDAYYEAALAAGATDNGAPGVRARHRPDYCGAFVIGPDGHNVEAVCHTTL